MSKRYYIGADTKAQLEVAWSDTHPMDITK